MNADVRGYEKSKEQRAKSEGRREKGEGRREKRAK
jgi:hypothetical protein